jgi:hypothetical protein
VIVVYVFAAIVLLLGAWAGWFFRVLNNLRWYGGVSSWTVRRNERRMRADLRSALGRRS